MSSESSFIVHDSSGLQLKRGPPSYESGNPSFTPFEGKVKCFISSADGKRLSWIAGGEVIVVEAPKWNKIGNLKHPRAQEIAFSPKGNYLAIWDIYSKVEGASAVPNLSVYDVTERKLLKSFFQQSQTEWKPQWTQDESLLVRSVSNEVHFYKANDLQNIENKKILPKVRSFSISPSVGTHYAIFFVPSLKGAPAYVHLYRYPDFSDNSRALAQKSFFKVDGIEVFWNPQCYAALILTSGDSDKSGSYYGEQMLFYLSKSGDSIRVTFAKQGSIRSVVWNHSGKEFFAVYGSAPARATLFDRKCDPIAEFGEGARNLVLINPLGNILMLGGLGNISSRFEMWDVKERKLIAQQDYPDITHMEWSPCGNYLLTSTCCPRLRVSNGYRVWHYTTVLQHEVDYAEPNELYSATWLPNPSSAKPFEISSSVVEGIQSRLKKASKERYVPPSQRSLDRAMVENVTKFLSQRDEPEDPELVAKKKELQKKKEKRDEKRKKKEQERGMDKDWRDAESRQQLEKQRKEKEAKIQSSGGGNKNKRIKNIKKKLESIEALKKEQESGRTLSNNELQKLSTEAPLLREMGELQAALHAQNNGDDAPDQLSSQVEQSLSIT